MTDYVKRPGEYTEALISLRNNLYPNESVSTTIGFIGDFNIDASSFVDMSPAFTTVPYWAQNITKDWTFSAPNYPGKRSELVLYYGIGDNLISMAGMTNSVRTGHFLNIIGPGIIRINSTTVSTNDVTLGDSITIKIYVTNTHTSDYAEWTFSFNFEDDSGTVMKGTRYISQIFAPGETRIYTFTESVPDVSVSTTGRLILYYAEGEKIYPTDILPNHISTDNWVNFKKYIKVVTGNIAITDLNISDGTGLISNTDISDNTYYVTMTITLSNLVIYTHTKSIFIKKGYSGFIVFDYNLDSIPHDKICYNTLSLYSDSGLTDCIDSHSTMFAIGLSPDGSRYVYY